jgi:hypothetical protein
VLVTPDVTAADMPAFSKDYGMVNALWASDPSNKNKISTRNILQKYLISPGGKSGRFDSLAEAKDLMSSPKCGTFRYPVAELTDPKARELWWMVERQKPDSVKTLVAVTKQKSTLGSDAMKIFAVVKTSFETRETELVQAPANMETYEGLEALLFESRGIELKKATDRYKELGKAKELKDEIQARSIYRQCSELLISPKGGAPETAKANLAALAKKYPDTKYGRLAAETK